ncbi:MAG: sigma-70 family RNA polymerase sigma factor [Hyphomicrobium sp.]|jgi:RNA polymerase sigma-70 factor (ECF subfamily)
MKPPRNQLDQLLASVGRGDEAAFAELYQATSAKLLAVALRILRNREAAEDVLQDCFFKIWEKAADFNPAIAQPLTWMAAIVRHRALDEVRRRGNRTFTDESEIEDLESDDEHPLEVLGRQEDVARLLRCLDGLDPEKKQIVCLAYLDGLSREALAKRFDRPEGTIKTWLYRSLAQLKGCLEQ